MTHSHWFKPYGWIYRPVSWPGWAVTVLALLFCVHIFVVIDSHAHSVSDTFYGIFPYVVPAFLTWMWIGAKTSGQR